MRESACGLQVVRTSVRLLHAMVDILSNKNALNACIVAMELCQMVTQALHTKDSFLLQLPGVTRALADKCEAAGIEELGSLQEMDDAARRRLLALPDAAYGAVADFCNRYPDEVSIVFAVTNGKDVSPPDDEEARAFEVDGDAGLVRCHCDLVCERACASVCACEPRNSTPDVVLLRAICNGNCHMKVCRKLLTTLFPCWYGRFSSPWSDDALVYGCVWVRGSPDSLLAPGYCRGMCPQSHKVDTTSFMPCLSPPFGMVLTQLQKTVYFRS